MRKLSKSAGVHPDRSEGQALLLVLLSMSVVLTIVLSILARSTLDIGVSSRSEESVRAFSAAEAGIEQALVAGSTGLVTIGNATFDAKVTYSSANEFILSPDLYSGESATVWFTSHDPSGNLVCPCFTGNEIEVCWGKEGTNPNLPTTPALEVSIVYLEGDYTTAKIARVVVDPNYSRRMSNSFSDPSGGGICTIDSKKFAFRYKFNLALLRVNTSGLQLARIALLYNNNMGHPVSVRVFGGNLPAQGVTIESIGRSDVSGGSTRKIKVTRGFKELPGIFGNVVFSQGGI